MSVSPPAFWRSKRYRLIGRHCTTCGRAHYPPLKVCPYCSSHNLRDVELPRRGKLVSYSIVYATPPDKRERTPLVVGLVDLGVVKLIAELTDVDLAELREEIEVEAVLRKLKADSSSGLIVYAIKFRPLFTSEKGSSDGLKDANNGQKLG
ncbi:MAG: OB-fold domain-containing protein [Acidilobaceae archaeon]